VTRTTATIGNALLGLCLGAALWACSPINQGNFDKIQNGMTMEQVKAILGEPTESSSLGLGPLSGTAAVWKGGNGTITVQFINNKVKLKTFEAAAP
jgi:hypothetical protein